jgi:hypothetical protein
MTKSVDYAIHVNYLEDKQCKLKTVIPVFKGFVTLTIEVSYAPIITMINVINTYPGMIGKNPKRDFSLFPRDWYRRGFKLFWEEEPGLRFNCWKNKRVWFLRHHCKDNGYYGYKLTDFYLAVTESDYSYEKPVSDIASNKQIETCELYNMNQNSIIDFTKRYNKGEVALYCRKCDPDFCTPRSVQVEPQ